MEVQVQEYKVLDAGCGRRQRRVELPPSAHVVGIDVSEKALDLNSQVDEKIVGDLQTYPLPAEGFDEIVCLWTLEHLPHPERALENMARALKPGGRLTIAVPNVASLKGVLTKFTPTRVHEWGYRKLGRRRPGKKTDFGPFKTYHRRFIHPRTLERSAERYGLELERLDLFEDPQFMRAVRAHRVAWRVVQAAWPEDPALSECEIVLRKRA